MKYLIKEGWLLNSNKKVVNAIIKRIQKCNGECPCVNPGKTIEDRMCPCRSYREDDICHCQLYIKKV